jgi:hypothetical protein
MILYFILLVVALIPALFPKALLKNPIPKTILVKGILLIWVAVLLLLHSLGEDAKPYWLNAAAVISYFMLAPAVNDPQKKEYSNEKNLPHYG